MGPFLWHAKSTAKAACFPEIAKYRAVHRILEWPGLERTTMIIQFQPPVMCTNHQTRLPRAQISAALIPPGPSLPLYPQYKGPYLRLEASLPPLWMCPARRISLACWIYLRKKSITAQPYSTVARIYKGLLGIRALQHGNGAPKELPSAQAYSIWSLAWEGI